VLVAVSLWAVVAMARDPLGQRPHWPQVAAVLGAVHGRHAIFLQGSSTWARPLGVLLPRTWWLRHRGARVREVDVVRRLPTAGDCPRATWWGALCDVGGRPALARPRGSGLRLVSRTRVAGFEIARFRARRPVHVVQSPGRHRHLLITPTRAPVVP
jgi:hypothetical protein